MVTALSCLRFHPYAIFLWKWSANRYFNMPEEGLFHPFMSSTALPLPSEITLAPEEQPEDVYARMLRAGVHPVGVWRRITSDFYDTSEVLEGLHRHYPSEAKVLLDLIAAS